MKKSLLALSAAALVGGLGFVTAAQAIVVMENDNKDSNFTAEKLNDVEVGGVGHILFTPYYSTVNGNTTLISLVNTDKKNGKAVKVRFRGAANSDDVLDFTVLLSPEDVWTASIEPSASGVAKIVSPDTTCVLPEGLKDGVDFLTTRLDPKLSDEAKAFHTREGYVEFLNMADIPAGTAVYKAIKHVDNKAPCTESVMEMLMNTEIKSVADAAGKDFGLVRPTGKLFGNWSIFNNVSVTSYGGGHAAVRAVKADGSNGAARLFFAPQSASQDPITAVEVTPGNHIDVAALNTADPILVGGLAGAHQKWVSGPERTPGSDFSAAVNPVWVDLPDLSTPYTKKDFSDTVNGELNKKDPQLRAAALSKSLAATAIMNEFIATPDSASVPFQTDWVFSQPTRRYQAAMAYSPAGADYKNMPVSAKLESTTARYYSVGIPSYTNNLSPRESKSNSGLALGDVLCVYGEVNGTNREEFRASIGGAFSPLPTVGKTRLCGEVATLTFNRAESKVLHASLTNERADVKAGGKFVDAGWATLSLKSAGEEGAGYKNNGLPVLGYAATAFSNGRTNGNFGDAIGHRYERP